MNTFRTFITFTMLLLLLGCIAMGFDSYYVKISNIYKKYRLNGAVAPKEFTALERYKRDLISLKKEFDSKNNNDAKAASLFIEIKLNLAEMQKNLMYGKQQLDVYSEFASCGTQFREAQDAIENALKEASSALSKYKLLKKTFPNAAKRIEYREGDIEKQISLQVDALNKINQQLKEICR